MEYTQNQKRDQAIDAQLIENIRDKFQFPILTSSVLAVLVAVVLRHEVPNIIMWTWLAVLLAINILRVIYFRRLDFANAAHEDLIKWVRYYTLGRL
tara:strand:+ start:292 stop:579 length:288 start_codon:yes stop_codon:yes gene_type:complete